MKHWYKLLPAVIPFCLFFTGGILLTLIQSLGLMNPLAGNEGPWSAYVKIFSEKHFLVSLAFSLYVALVSAFLSTVFGTLLAHTIWQLPERLRARTQVYKIPLILPHIAVAFITILFLGQSGALSSLTYNLGITESSAAFPHLVFSRFGIGEIIAYTAKETSFVAVMVLAVLLKFDKRYLSTARQLGAGRVRIFFSIVLPSIKDTLATTFLILFIFSFGAFEIPYILGNSTPGMLSLQVYDYYFKHDLSQRPVAMALLMVLLVISSLLAWIYFSIHNRTTKGSRNE